MHELLDKNWKRKKKRKEQKVTDHMIGQKRRELWALCHNVFLAQLNKSWLKVSIARHAVNEGAKVSDICRKWLRS